MQRINITLPDELVRDLRRAIAERKRSKFIAEAVSEKLKKKRNLKKDWIKSLKANKKLYQEVQKDWAPIDVENWPD